MRKQQGKYYYGKDRTGAGTAPGWIAGWYIAWMHNASIITVKWLSKEKTYKLKEGI